jgi:preprotein translocase SecE subunit
MRAQDAAQGNKIRVKEDGIIMDKTFSWSGIKKEAKRVRWPKKEDTFARFGEVLIFSVFFALFFILCDLLVSGILTSMGVGA